MARPASRQETVVGGRQGPTRRTAAPGGYAGLCPTTQLAQTPAKSPPPPNPRPHLVEQDAHVVPPVAGGVWVAHLGQCAVGSLDLRLRDRAQHTVLVSPLQPASAGTAQPLCDWADPLSCCCGLLQSSPAARTAVRKTSIHTPERTRPSTSLRNLLLAAPGWHHHPPPESRSNQPRRLA